MSAGKSFFSLCFPRHWFLDYCSSDNAPVYSVFEAAEDTSAYRRNSCAIAGDFISGPMWDKPESWSSRAQGIHALWAALGKYLDFVSFFFFNWIGSFVPWGKEAPGKSCHKRFLCSSLTGLKWRLFTMKMLCLWEKFHLLNLSVSSMFWCARSLHSALKGVRKGECLQWLWHNFLISATGIGGEGSKEKSNSVRNKVTKSGKRSLKDCHKKQTS